MTRRHVIVCEGHDDQIFWSAWLESLQCKNLRPPPGGGRVEDPVTGTPLPRSDFGFETPGGTFVLVRPSTGREKISGTVQNLIDEHATHPIVRLIVNLDSDADADDVSDTGIELVRQSIGSNAGQDGGDGPWDLNGISTYAVIWRSDDVPGVDGVPEKQTLERLICAAIAAAHPDQARAVHEWLRSNPIGGNGHKHHAMSYFAKWYLTRTQYGIDQIYRRVWQDDASRAELKKRLCASGAWAHVAALVAD